MGTEHKVIVADDNEFIRMQIISYLQDAGYLTIEASDGYEALESMNKTISLAIIDIHMEPMDGFSLISSMCEYEYKTPIIVITGDQTPEVLEKAKVLGIKDILIKPIKKEELIPLVEKLIKGSCP